MLQSSQPTPERVFETLTAYQDSAALAAAIELELFTRIGEGADTLAALAERVPASERGLRALCSYMVVREFLAQEGERYRLTQESALFLDRRSPHYMGSVSGFLTSDGLRRCFERLPEAVRRGGTVEEHGGTVAGENPVWVEFARAMQPMAQALAPGLAEAVCRPEPPRRVLDIAAGHGLYGIEIARRSETTEVVAQDWAGVLEVARENAQAAGVERRYRTLPGSAFEVSWGRDFDCVLLTNFLHHFSAEECTVLLSRARTALREGGRVAVLEFVVGEDRVSPPHPATFDLVMLATTQRGQAYTFAEYERMFLAAGLGAPERHELEPAAQAVLVAGIVR